MPLTLMYITNNAEVAQIAQRAGVDRIWIDMEYIGKEERQGGMDTVKSHHTIDDVIALRPYVKDSELMVRINPVHDATDAYMSTEEEIEKTIAAGADVIMLPMFKTAEEVDRFLRAVNGRAKTSLLFETAESIANMDAILELNGIDEVHVGLNDLHLAYGRDFMFEVLCDGTVAAICEKFKNKGIKFGFGGIARVGYGMLPAEHIIAEHYALGSTAAILSRGFCDANKVNDPKTIEEIFIEGIQNIRKKEEEVSKYSTEQYEENRAYIKEKVQEIVERKRTNVVPQKKICIATTVSITMKSFVVETAKYLQEKCGYDITLICNPDAEFEASLPNGIRFMPVSMGRGIDFSALRSIRAFYKIFKKEKFDLVQYSTPNASLYASIAARLSRVPIRLYCQWGIRYVGMQGISRKIFHKIEQFVCRLSTAVKSVSPLNMEFGIREKLYKAEKVQVIGNGGTIGVDMQQYAIGKKALWREEIRKQHSIPTDAFVFGFAGRVSADKGCTELLSAFRRIAEENEKATLLIVGPVEKQCGVDAALLDWAMHCERVISTGLTKNSEMCRYYSAMDVLVHPTYREGFGMVIQEAGALAVPTITTKIIGASEVMEDGKSCVLVPSKDSDTLYTAMHAMLTGETDCKKFGEEAYVRTERLYARPLMLENQRQAYMELLK